MKKSKKYIHFGKGWGFEILPRIQSNPLRWKDKFDTPRCEWCPYFQLSWLWFIFTITWGDDQYWEQWLWVNKYYNGDYQKAKEEWGWVDYKTKESTWIDY